MSAALHLYLPGLLNPSAQAAAELPATPALNMLLARGRHGRIAGGTRALAARLFDVPKAVELPVAALTRLADTGCWDTAYWLRMDPVLLQADRDTLVLFDAEPLQIQLAEARALGNTLNDYLAAEGLQLEVPEPDRWYLRLPAAPDCRFHDLDTVQDRSVLAFMPQGREAARFRRLLNECQMLLHEHPVNAGRELPVNGVWLWGGGAFDEWRPRSWARVHSLDPLFVGLALLAGSEIESPPDSLAEWFAHGAGKPELVSLDALRSAVRRGDAPAWRQTLAEWEETWFAPLLLAFKDKLLDELVLYTDEQMFQVTRGALRKFWKQPRALAAYADAAADREAAP